MMGDKKMKIVCANCHFQNMMLKKRDIGGDIKGKRLNTGGCFKSLEKLNFWE
jgi:hypothetical protein